MTFIMVILLVLFTNTKAALMIVLNTDISIIIKGHLGVTRFIHNWMHNLFSNYFQIYSGSQGALCIAAHLFVD